MKCPLTTRTKFVNSVISLKDKSLSDIKGALMEDLKTYCNEYCEMYALIVHDKDLLEDNSPKTTHIHAVLLMKTNRQRLSTILSDIAGYLSISPLSIQIEKMSDVNGSIQYLIHKNDSQKHQYDISEIITNLQPQELDVYMSGENGTLSINSLMDIVINCNYSLVKIMQIIGLGYYQIYRNTIKDIINELRGY